MKSMNIDQLVINGSIPLSYASSDVARHILNMNNLEEPLINDLFKLSVHKLESHSFTSDVLMVANDFSQQHSISDSSIAQMILAQSSFSNKNMTMLLRSALVSGTVPFRLVLHDFKMTYKRIFAQEINQPDKHQNTLLWYLTVAGLYSSVEELYRIALIELNVNVKNGQLGQTILHYAVVRGNIEGIRIILDIGVNTNLCDRYSRTALHYIALCGTKYKNDVEIMKLLIDHGILPNLEDNMDQTSLHIAIIKENYHLVEYLITLSNINVCIRNKHGYTPLCYICEHILNICDNSFENNQYINILERIFKIINQIIDRCPCDELAFNFHITNNNKLGENLLLRVYNKLINLNVPLHTNALFHRLEFIINGTDQDHRLCAEQFLKLHSWKSAIFALCNTHNVNITNVLIQYIAHDPHLVLTDNISPSSDLSIVCLLILYALASNLTVMEKIVPMCQVTTKEKTKRSIDGESKTMCHLYITNNNLHTNYVTFIHTCLHYASLNVFSLKHLCRYYIRRSFKSQIINKIDQCPHLNVKQRDYIKLNELSLIYSKIQDLTFIIYLIKRLYNIHEIEECDLFEHEINPSPQSSLGRIDTASLSSSIDISLYDNTVQNQSDRSDTTDMEYKTKIDDVKPARQRTIEEIMADSKISSDNSTDQTEESETSVKTFTKDINFSLETNNKSTFSFSNEELSTEQFESELADMNSKSKNIEEMIEKFLSKN